MKGQGTMRRSPTAAATMLYLGSILAACASGEPVRPPALMGRDTAAQFRGGPSHHGVYAGADFSALGSAAWSACTGGAVRSSPAIASGTVFVGSGDGRLRAFDLSTGALRWGYDAGSPIPSSPAVVGDRVIAASRDGVIHAVDARSGRAAWTVPTGPERAMPWGREGWDYFISSPTAIGSGEVLVAGGDGTVRRIRAADGAVLAVTDLGTRLRSSPAYGNGRAFVGGSDGVVYAVDIESGEVVWRHETEGTALSSESFGYDRRTVQSSPAVADGILYVGGRDGRLYALDEATGTRIWTAEYSPSWVVSSPVVRGGLVYTGTSDALKVEALDAATGEVVWSRPMGTRVLGSPSLVGGVLLVPGNDGYLTALDAGSGEVLWRHRAGGMLQSSPAVAGELALFGDDGGHVVALRAGEVTPRLAVFHDTALAGYATRPGGSRLADDLEDAGYARLDAASLGTFLLDRIADRAPSVVVFALDHVPDGVAPGGRPGLLRRYLDAGGKVVWPGLPPHVIERDSTGRAVAFRAERAETVSGVDFAAALGSDHAARPTAVGLRWGLERVRLSALAPVDTAGITVLASDEMGRAAAFVRPFGGGEGTGFVYLWGQGYRADMLPEVRRVAEYGVLTDPEGRFARMGACPSFEPDD